MTEFTYLSASNVNSFISRRPLWFLERVKGYKFPVGPVVHRGSAVEIGAIAAINTGDEDSAINMAMADYSEKVADWDIDEAEDAGKPIPDMIKACADYLRTAQERHGKILKTQGRIETALPDWPEMNWLGFTDLEFEDGHILDIKTKKQTPSKLSDDWIRQGSIYRTGRGTTMSFVCIVGLETKITVRDFELSDEDMARGLHQLNTYGRVVEQVLSHTNPSRLAPLFMPSTDDWALSDPMIADAAKTVWGI